MKTLIVIGWLSITLGFCVEKVSSQGKPPKTITVETTKPFDLNGYKEWKKVEFTDFSLYVPKEFKLQEFRGVDGGGWRHVSPNFLFSISSGWVQDAPFISDEKRPSYKEKFTRIGKVLVRLWFYEDKTPPEPFVNHPYFGQIAFSDPTVKGQKHAIALWSKEAKGLDLLEKMLVSIKFK
jgi:hypothetical protein